MIYSSLLCLGAATEMRAATPVAVTRARCRLRTPMVESRCGAVAVSHFVASGQVLVRSCVSVFAVTTTRVLGIVERPHKIAHAATVDSPTPCPLSRAIRIGSRFSISEPSRSRRPSSASSSRCQSRGPGKRLGPVVTMGLCSGGGFPNAGYEPHPSCDCLLTARSRPKSSRNRWFADSLLERTGFEFVVPLRDWYRSCWVQLPGICEARRRTAAFIRAGLRV